MSAKKKDAFRNHADCLPKKQHEIHKHTSHKNNNRYILT